MPGMGMPPMGLSGMNMPVIGMSGMGMGVPGPAVSGMPIGSFGGNPQYGAPLSNTMAPPSPFLNNSMPPPMVP